MYVYKAHCHVLSGMHTSPQQSVQPPRRPPDTAASELPQPGFQAHAHSRPLLWDSSAPPWQLTCIFRRQTPGCSAPHGFAQLLRDSEEFRAGPQTTPQQHGRPEAPHCHMPDPGTASSHVTLYRPCSACRRLFLVVARGDKKAYRDQPLPSSKTASTP